MTDISVIIPCRNEKRHIRKTIQNLLLQDGVGRDFSYEIIVVDGMSDDGTADIIMDESRRNKNVKLVINNKKITPAAFNLGIENSSGKYICILGAHAEINRDYLLSCLKTIRSVDADNVGGPWRVRGDGYIGETIALAFQNSFSSGGAKSHNPQYAGYLDSVWGGFYKREVFDKIGLFDEELARNQDDELNYRLTKSGGRIWQSPEIKYHYVCRNSIRRLFMQYLQYGYWKVKVIQKHKIPASIRHIVPACFIGLLVLLLLMLPFSNLALRLFIYLTVLYASVNLFFTLLICSKPSLFKYLPALPVVFASYHFSYGAGFLRGFLELLLRKNARQGLFTKLTRG